MYFEVKNLLFVVFQFGQVVRFCEQEVADVVLSLTNILNQGPMIVIKAGFIPLPPLSIVSTVVMWESSHWLGKYCVEYWLKRTPGKHV